MHVPAYYEAQLRAEKQASARPPSGDGEAESAQGEALPDGPASAGHPPGAAPFRLAPIARVAPFLILFGLAACKRGPEGVGATPPASTPSAFLAEAVGLCRESCAPRDAAWTASEVAGATHVSCSCPPLSTLQPGPKVHRNRAARAQKAASVKRSDGPEGPVAVAEGPTP